MKQPEMKKYPDGTRVWYQDGQRHREDGPAIEYYDGDREWYIRGQQHRQDGPAIERASGTREWWFNDHLHREDGPAVEWADGTREWWIRGRQLTEEEFNNHRFRIWAVEGRLIGTTEETTT